MYLIITPSSEYKAKKWKEVIDFFSLFTYLDISDFPGLPGGSWCHSGYSIEKCDGRTLRDIQYLPI